MVVSAEMPTSIPTIRATTTKGAGEAVDVVVGGGEHSGVDRGEGQPEPEPPKHQRAAWRPGLIERW